jgi:acetyl esterase/lipase
MSGEPSFFFPHARYFASRGMVAISVQYRVGGEAPGGIFGCLADCKSAMRYLRSHADSFGIDPDRIAVAGDSAGGHLAAALGLFDGFNDPEDDLSVSVRPNAMLLYNPVLDLVDLKWTRNRPGIRKPGAKEGWDESPERVLKHGESPAERARAFSPMFNIESGQPPALLMNGTDDKTTPVEHATRFAERYVDEGNRCELVVLEDVAHAFVLINYTAEEEIQVRAIREGDKFLESLGYLEGNPTLQVKNNP